MHDSRNLTIRLLQLLMVSCVAIPISLLLYAALSTHRSVSAATDERLERWISVLQEHALRVFNSTELAIHAVDANVRGLPDKEIRERQDLHAALVQLRDAAQIQSLWVFDRDGRPLVTSSIYPVPNINNADRDYFRAHVTKDAGTFIGEAVEPRLPGNLIFTISRRRPSLEGAFLGVTAAALSTSAFHRFYEQIAEAPGSQLAMVREDGVMLARHPEILNRALRLDSSSGFGQLIAKQPLGGFYTTVSAIDSIERRFAVHRIPGYPVYVTAGIETSLMRSQIVSTLASHLVFGIPATAVLLAAIAVVLRRTRRVFSEIDQRTAVESQLRQSQKMEAIGQLTGGLAHDFNNILMVVIGNLDFAARRLPEISDASFSRWIQNALHGAKRAASLTQQLLAFARRQPLDPKPTDVNTLIRQLSDFLRRAVGETISVEIVGGGGLWLTEIDQAQLEASLLNLFVNARDAMPKGGKLTVETGNAFLDEHYCGQHDDVRPGQYVLIAVTDTGTGMPPSVAAQAFQPFFTTKAAGHGTGLGLSQVYGFVRQSGGHIKIYSEEKEGTTVKLYLPRYYGPSIHHEDNSKAVQPGDLQATVLVVEDDADVRDYVCDALRALNVSVLQAPDATRALDVLATEAHKIDVILTDVVLPGMNGRELADKAVSRWPALKVLFMTGYSRNAIIHQGRLDLGVAMLQKPFTQQDLISKLQEILSREPKR
jgi:two-component system NtrC family sensor kinase